MFVDISIRNKYSGLRKINIFIKINSQQGNRRYKFDLTGTLQFTRIFIRVHTCRNSSLHKLMTYM